MLEFFPWSRRLLDESYNNYSLTRKMQLLDIELGGACNFNCIYCDTPKYRQKIEYTINQLELLFLQQKPTCLYICGLGEPTFAENECDLYKVLDLCSQHSVPCCMFTNLTNLSGIAKYIEQGILYPIFKLDSFDIKIIKQIYNTNENLANLHYNNITSIPSLVRIEEGHTNIAASIVPSSINYEGIKALITWCKNNNIFPLIGQLEDAGKGHDAFNALCVSDDDLAVVKQFFLECYGEPYLIPICPSVLFGIHINHSGCIVVDKVSGLSCHWFWLTEPQIFSIGHFYDQSVETISIRIIAYRLSRADNVREIYATQKEMIFGGCGGDIKYLLEYYISKML